MSQAMYKRASLLALVLAVGGASAFAQEAHVFRVRIGENYHIYEGKLIVREGGKAELYDLMTNSLVSLLKLKGSK